MLVSAPLIEVESRSSFRDLSTSGRAELSVVQSLTEHVTKSYESIPWMSCARRCLSEQLDVCCRASGKCHHVACSLASSWRSEAAECQVLQSVLYIGKDLDGGSGLDCSAVLARKSIHG